MGGGIACPSGTLSPDAPPSFRAPESAARFSPRTSECGADSGSRPPSPSRSPQKRRGSPGGNKGSTSFVRRFSSQASSEPSFELHFPSVWRAEGVPDRRSVCNPLYTGELQGRVASSRRATARRMLPIGNQSGNGYPLRFRLRGMSAFHPAHSRLLTKTPSQGLEVGLHGGMIPEDEACHEAKERVLDVAVLSDP